MPSKDRHPARSNNLDRHGIEEIPNENKHWRFGWSNEGSNPARGHYDKAKDRGLPRVVNLPDERQQPHKKQQVHTCYSTFVDWVNSGGIPAVDWYKIPVAGCVFPTK